MLRVCCLLCFFEIDYMYLVLVVGFFSVCIFF